MVYYETATPSLALKIGHSLGRLAAIKRCNALRRNDTKMVKEVQRCIQLKEAERAEQVSLEVLKTMHKRKQDKLIELPDSDDKTKIN